MVEILYYFTYKIIKQILYETYKQVKKKENKILFCIVRYAPAGGGAASHKSAGLTFGKKLCCATSPPRWKNKKKKEKKNKVILASRNSSLEHFSFQENRRCWTDDGPTLTLAVRKRCLPCLKVFVQLG